MKTKTSHREPLFTARPLSHLAEPPLGALAPHLRSGLEPVRSSQEPGEAPPGAGKVRAERCEGGGRGFRAGCSPRAPLRTGLAQIGGRSALTPGSQCSGTIGRWGPVTTPMDCWNGRECSAAAQHLGVQGGLQLTGSSPAWGQ